MTLGQRMHNYAWRRIKRLSALCSVGMACLSANAGEPEEQDLSTLSLEELGNVPAIVSSKLPSQVFDAPTGSFIFDSELIEQLPVDSIPEMLRYAPGVHIIRPSNGIWGIGMRGINSRFFNRVQFTVDEQNVYANIFAGLFGNQHDVLMEDVASVEVAYGPGGGTWANSAVNGRINVLMKTAFETEGSLLKVGIGTQQRSAAARIGWAINEDTSARVYAQLDGRESSETRFDYSNAWETAKAGFRLDKRLSSQDLLSFSLESFYSDLGYAYDLANYDTGTLTFASDAERIKGSNAQLKWTRNLADGSEYSVRSWLAYSEYDAPYAKFDIATAGIEGRARIAVGQAHFLNFSLGSAADKEHTTPTPTADWTSDTLRNHTFYTSIQHDWSLIEDKLDFSWGLDVRYEDKFATTSYSPNSRLIYQINDAHRIWLSYSQAERATPVSLSVIESLRSGKTIDPPAQTPYGPVYHSLINARSDQQLEPERLDAFEAGYRGSFGNGKGTFSLNSFYYIYDDLIARFGTSYSPSEGTESRFLDIHTSYDNLLQGYGYGYEANVSWAFNDRLETGLSYSRLVDTFETIYETTDPTALFSLDEFDNSSPGHMANLTLSADLTEDINWFSGLRYSAGYDFAKGNQPAIFQLDTRLSWQAKPNLRISLIGRNLLDETTQEARLKDFFGHWTEIEREVTLEVRADF